MALATRPKPTVHHKKRNARHHRHSKHYFKPYLPYLPMLMVVVLGFTVNSFWVPTAAATPVSRVEVLAGGSAPWLLAAVAALAGAAFALFIARHGLHLHKALVRGEAFIIKHPLLDIAIVFIFMAGFVLTRPGGVIQ